MDMIVAISPPPMLHAQSSAQLTGRAGATERARKETRVVKINALNGILAGRWHLAIQKMPS